jgi:GT2 family glycosyltransferase
VRREQIGRAAQEWARQHDAAWTAAQFERIYRDLQGRRFTTYASEHYAVSLLSPMTDIGGVIVSYNTREVLRRCLQALAASRGVAVTVAVVDNGSSDGSAAMVAEAFPNALLVRNAANRGFGAATNQGLRLFLGWAGDQPNIHAATPSENNGRIAVTQQQITTCEYILLLNSDAFVEPGALACMCEYLQANPAVGAVAPQLRNADGSLQPTGRPFPTLRTKLADISGWSRRGGRNNYLVAGRDYDAIAPVDEVPAACVLVRRAVFEQVGGFDEGFRFNYEDVDWCRRVAAAGWSIVYLPAARVTHLWGASQQARREWVELQSRRGLLRYFAKHGRRFELFGLRCALLVFDLARIGRWGARWALRPAERPQAREKLSWRVRIFATLVAPQGELP